MEPFQMYKSQVVDTAQELTRKGYLMATGGNISIRILGQNAFALKGSADIVVFPEISECVAWPWKG